MVTVSTSNASKRGGSFVRRVHGTSADIRPDHQNSGRRVERTSRKLERINRETPWYELSEREFSAVMIEMEDATVDFYENEGGFSSDYGPEEDAAIREFWDREWGAVYNWRNREWRHTLTGKRFESEGEKQAKLIWVERIDQEEADATAAASAASAAAASAVFHDPDDCARDYVNSTAFSINGPPANGGAGSSETGENSWSGLDWLKEYDDYHNYGWYDKGWSWDQEYHVPEVANSNAAAATATATGSSGAGVVVGGIELKTLNSLTPSTQLTQLTQVPLPLPVVCCQGVLYLEEQTSEPGNPDWRMFIYYDEGKRRYIVKGSRRSIRPKSDASKPTSYPDVRLAFRRSTEVLDYLSWCMNARPVCDLVMYAMCCDTVDKFTVSDLCSMKPYGKKTELYGYNALRVTRDDLRDQLYVLRSTDWKYSTFDNVQLNINL